MIRSNIHEIMERTDILAYHVIIMPSIESSELSVRFIATDYSC